MFDMIGQIASAGINGITTGIVNSQNEKLQNRSTNWAYADRRAANRVYQYYADNGNLDNFNMKHRQDYNDVADYYNPMMQIQSYEFNKNMAEKSHNLAQQQYDTSKDLAYNGVSIRANDYRRAGINPLLAVNNSASFSPVSTGGGSANAGTLSHDRPGQATMQTPAPVNLKPGNTLLDYINQKAQARLLNAQAEKMEAETTTEKHKPENIQADTDFKLQQIENSKTDNNYKMELINSEMKKQKLTQSQIDYYDEQVKSMQHDLQLSEDSNTKLHETLPYNATMISEMLDTMGVDRESSLYPFLYTATTALLAYSGHKVTGKTKQTTTRIDQNGNKSTTKTVTSK